MSTLNSQQAWVPSLHHLGTIRLPAPAVCLDRIVHGRAQVMEQMLSFR